MNGIAIIGGGIGGLVTALCFEKLGIPFKVYERAVALKHVGAGIWLSPNALQVIEWIDPKLLKEIEGAGNYFDRIMVANHQLIPLSDSDQAFVKHKFGYTTIAIHRGVLQRIIYSYLPKEKIILGKEFKKYEKTSDTSYRIEFEDGTSVETNTIIGADGVNSKVRGQLFPNSSIRYSGQTCWRGVADYKLDPKFASVGFTLWGKKLQFGVSKLNEEQTYWFAVKLSEPNQEDEREKLKVALNEMFSAFHPVVNELIQHTRVSNIIRGDLSDLELLDKWHVENICLIGDAAHSMTPDLGQGGAQAIEDAYYLSNFINSSKCIEDAFHRFHSSRKTKVEKLVKQSRFASKIAITNRPVEILRNFVLRNTPERFMQSQMIELYTIDKSVAALVG
ncbi:FAD-dependent monooxygenase [Neolewinella antarctica]|uniref:2-polyprenyl-6-methoxyphenol hydroxylase-like FAD-dependent oxidoreductase n=1 Tax=Neolewinella antarctica TaxID=442734 RepID=A0ABX0XID0_9BACT|nr:FAD-dependent monooxygenase [Neolewinella antarctica]NJC28487.1 2-polyprenyl-6-methoxyphenol hydroxylase-like FAD-dependent oxidoreductase [Neolewinella antarctica]